MIQGQNIICFCNDWDGDPLSKKQIVTRLARHNRILWVNSTGTRNPTISAHDFRRALKKLREFLRGCRPVAEGISLFCPLVIPFHGYRVARWINRHLLAWSLRRACRKLRFENPITLTFVPSTADVVGHLDESMIVYYCVDEYSQFSGTDQAAMLAMERSLIEKADFVVVSAERLHATKRIYNANTFLITHGVDVAHFRKACFAETVPPEEIARLSHPVIGFFGLIADWVDIEVIRYVAAARPQWSIFLIGDVRTDVSSLRKLPNVHFAGRQPYASLPAYAKAFDVAILPFVMNELTLAANPLKLREYLAAGLPVVATPLPEVRRLGEQVRTAATPAAFLSAIESFLAEGRRGPDLAVSRSMDRESWDGKVEQLSRLLANADRRTAEEPLTARIA